MEIFFGFCRQLERQVDLRSEWFGEDFAQDFRKSLCIRVTSEGVRSPVKSSENSDL